jgi:hypothetical protein
MLFFLFAFQGFLTFSRGGMIVGFVAISTFIFLLLRFYLAYKKSNIKISKFRNAIFILLFSLISYLFANSITGGVLGLRYSGQTKGTYEGYKEQTINNITSNRYDIFIGDLSLWNDNTIFGVGVGASQHLREKVNGTVAHVELSRLLSEHGLFGLIFFLMMVTIPITIMNTVSDRLLKSVKYALFVFAISTTFHAAMRTYVTPLFLGLSVLGIRNGNNLSYSHDLRLSKTN